MPVIAVGKCRDLFDVLQSRHARFQHAPRLVTDDLDTEPLEPEDLTPGEWEQLMRNRPAGRVDAELYSRV